MDGCLTSNDPLLFTQPQELLNIKYEGIDVAEDELAPLSLGYLKGMARLSTVHSILTFCYLNNIDLSTKNAKLWKSLAAIFGHFWPCQTRVDEGLRNLKLSTRGSIRKMANVIQVAVMVCGLVQNGLVDWGAFVRKWNAMSGRSHQIIGKKALALKYLFEMTPRAFVCYQF